VNAGGRLTTLGMVVRNGWAGRYGTAEQMTQALDPFTKL
jgi:hypothetical protein